VRKEYKRRHDQGVEAASAVELRLEWRRQAMEDDHNAAMKQEENNKTSMRALIPYLEPYSQLH